MTYGYEETLCTSCIHKDICSKKDTYLAAQEAVNNASVHLKKGSMINLRNLTWIEKVKLKCKYYYAATTNSIRGYEIGTGPFTIPCDNVYTSCSNEGSSESSESRRNV